MGGEGDIQITQSAGVGGVWGEGGGPGGKGVSCLRILRSVVSKCLSIVGRNLQQKSHFKLSFL